MSRHVSNGRCLAVSTRVDISIYTYTPRYCTYTYMYTCIYMYIYVYTCQAKSPHMMYAPGAPAAQAKRSTQRRPTDSPEGGPPRFPPGGSETVLRNTRHQGPLKGGHIVTYYSRAYRKVLRARRLLMYRPSLRPSVPPSVRPRPADKI